MGASSKIKTILKDKGMTQAELAKQSGKERQPLYNMLYRDNMTYATVEKMLDAIGCDICFFDRETGRIYF